MSTETLPGETVTPADLGLAERPPKAGPGDDAAHHVRTKIDAQLRAMLHYEPGTRSGADPEDLHQMRVAVRRSRSVLKLSGHLLGPGAERVRAELGWLGGSLGEVRDYDVLIGHLREVVADFDERDQPAADALIAVFTGQRGRAKGRLTRALSSARYRRLLDAMAGLVLHEPEPAGAPEGNGKAPGKGAALVTTLRKPYRRLRKAVDALPADPPDDDLHELRIHGKRLRYAAELARPAAGKKSTKQITRLIKATKDLQDVLGDHQDAVVAADRMRALLDTGDPRIAFIAGRIAEREHAKRSKARELWRPAITEVTRAARPLL